MSSASIDRKRARELVERIALENGFVSESVMESIPQDARLQIEKALLAKDKKIGTAVLTLAKNLYTSNARFVFELLQNADDNHYTKLASGKDPFVSFSLYSDRLIVECNEDGFTERNLQAICDVGNSSKSQSQAYIGEKGIGFKSVFMAAWKAHIQSGHLSFSFVHRKGDSGMGMVSPIWEEPTEELEHSLTRITLFLHGDQDGGQIRRQFRELEPALLLFVRRLRRIDISFHGEDGQQEWATRLTRRDPGDTNLSILTRRVSDTKNLDRVFPEARIYHVTKHMATNIAKGENRTLSAKEEASRSYSQSEIVLAFPLSNESVPIIEAQRVFAFLPMGQMGFNFLIQADFVTQASREGVVTTSRRNQDLIKAVGDAVIKAVGQFCQHPSLQYTWMRYLPQDGTHHWDSFWKGLVDSIKERLLGETVLRSRGKGELRRIRDLKYRTHNTNDQYGFPLFRDVDPEIYLSDSYTKGDIDILKHFGLESLQMSLFLDTVRQDLLSSGKTSSILRSEYTGDDWHARASSSLGLPFRNKWKDQMAKVQKLDIIPLDDGSWVSATSGVIFYGSIGDIPVPKDLGLRIVADGPAKNAKRRELFNHLGVQTANAGKIRSLILQRYSQKDAHNIGLQASLQHLRFLYLTHKSRAKDEHSDLAIAKLLIHTTTTGNSQSPASQDLYIQDDHPYGAYSLLGSPGLSSVSPSFVHQMYFECAPDTPRSMGITWKEWMYEYLGVRRNVRLLSRDKNSISAACKYIAENHSQKLLGFLKHVWPEEGHLVAAADDVRNELAEIDVLCTNGKMIPLRETYLPLNELREVQLRFGQGEFLPFLDLPHSDDRNLLSKWSFLTDVLGVGSKDDLDFRLALLSVRQDSDEETASTLLAVFKYIQAFCAGSPDPQATSNRVYDHFQEHSCILTPYHDEDEVDWWWVPPECCLWEAPAMMDTFHPLRADFSRVLGIKKSTMDDLQSFFKGTLRIPDISHTHIIEELESRHNEAVAIEFVRELYKLLQDMWQADPGISEYLRDSFEEEELVCVDRHGSLTWHSPSQCLWSSSTCIEGKVAISDLYSDFEPLFREVLGVSPVDLNLLYDSLLEAPSNSASVEKVKQLLLDFNSLLPSTKEPPAPGALIQLRIFPVRSPGGETTLCSHEDEFVVVDREELFGVFGDRVRYLDFSLKQVCRLRPFISWAGLEAKYLSRRIEEVSRVVDGSVERPIADPDRDVRMKAYGLLRIAAKYDSPRFNADPQGLYDLLHNAVTVEAGGISSRLVIHQDGNTFEHEISKSELHLEEKNGSLKIYVPRDKDDREICYLHTLPRRILSWMMEPRENGDRHGAALDHAAISVVNSILNCRVSAVSALLKKDGVPEITEVEEEEPPPETEDALARLPVTPTQGRRSLEPSPPSAAPLSVMSATTPEPLSSPWDYDGLGYTTPLTDLGSYSDDSETEPGGRTPVYAGSTIRDLKTIQSRYKQLLGVVVEHAQGMAHREYGSLDLSSALAGLSLADDVFTPASSGHGAFSTAQDRFVKIGAAGELFVFEFLSNLSPALPSFGRSNWQSRIRHHAAVHPKYTDLSRFAGLETSDIVYDDASGVFTELLIRKGHLASAHWAGKTPKYYIEVKSTLAQCKTPLFISDGQAARMLRSTNGPSGNENQDVVYAIFRVFNLGTGATGLKIYVDPEQQRRTGKLKFIADRYTVVPGPGA